MISIESVDLVVIGVDPGKEGSIYIEDLSHSLESPQRRKFIDLEHYVDDTGDYDEPQLAEDLFKALKGRKGFAFIERVRGWGEGSSNAMFNFGAGYGAVVGILSALGFRIIKYPPQQWKCDLGLNGKSKKASRALASKLDPNLKGSLARAKDHDRAEASLLAFYGGGKTERILRTGVIPPRVKRNLN